MLLKITKTAFLLLIFSLPIANLVYLPVYQQRVLVAEFVFVIVALLAFLCVVFGKLKVKSSWLYLPLGLYFAALLASTVFSENVSKSSLKLAGEVYLIGLSLLTFNLVGSVKDIRRLTLVWLCAAVFASLVSVISFALFYLDRSNLLLTYTLSHYGTLPAGNYPRIQGLFMNPNMYCHYLTIAWLLLALAYKMKWIKTWLFWLCFSLFGFASIFTVSPNLGGVILALGLFYWQGLWKTGEVFRSRLVLAACSFAAVVFLASAVFYPSNVTDNAFDFTLRPSIRYEAWKNSLETFSQYPVFGKGLDADIARTAYRLDAARSLYITDAHQIWLNVAGQSGILGLAAFFYLCLWLTRRSWPIVFDSEPSVIRSTLLIAFITAVFYGGLIGSYENARHLWILIGLLAATLHFDQLTESEDATN